MTSTSAEEESMRDYRTHRPGTYQEMTSGFRWEVPASYNLAADVLDKHEPDRPAMRFVSDEGRDERWSFGDMRRLTDRTANTLRGLGVGKGDRVAVMAPASDPDTPAQLYYTSGTTGLAKGILHAHRYLLGHEEFQFSHDVRAGELFHSTGEWAWIAGIVPGILGPWRFGGGTLVHGRKGGFDPGKALRLIADHGVGNLFTTPTAIRAMMGVSEAAGLDFGTLRLACSAGEPLNPEAIAWWNRTVGCPVLDYYGLSESYPLCANYPTVEVRPGSMGLPLPGWEVAILDPDEQPVPQGDPGEICLKARSNPHYPLGYWNRPEDSQEVFGGDWFHTKDTARQDEDGYVWYSGRADDVIISAGYRIGPFE